MSVEFVGKQGHAWNEMIFPGFINSCLSSQLWNSFPHESELVVARISSTAQNVVCHHSF